MEQFALQHAHDRDLHFDSIVPQVSDVDVSVERTFSITKLFRQYNILGSFVKTTLRPCRL